MRFIFVDRILELEKGKRAVLVKNVSSAEEYFSDHFPGFPVMPGSLILETMEQGAHLLLSHGTDFACGAALEEVTGAKFKRFVRPGDQLTVRLAVTARDEARAEVSARVSAGEEVVAEATLAFLLLEGAKDPTAATICRSLKELFDLLTTEPRP